MLNLKSIIHNLPSAVMVVGSDRRVIMANRMAELFLGENEAGLIGKRYGDALCCKHAAESSQKCGHEIACRLCEANQAVVRTFKEKLDIEPFEAEIATQQNGTLHLKFTVTLIENLMAAPGFCSDPAAIFTVDDMTEYKQRERLAVAMETVGTICHELNQPLTVLTGQLELLEMDIGEHERLAIFRDQVDRMGQITKRLRKLRYSAAKSHTNDTGRLLDTAPM